VILAINYQPEVRFARHSVSAQDRLVRMYWMCRMTAVVDAQRQQQQEEEGVSRDEAVFCR
jgi:hypothetical protein